MRSRSGNLFTRHFEKIGRASIGLLDWVLIVAVLPFALIKLAQWAGLIAAWLAIALVVAYGLMSFRPMPIPMGSTRGRAKATCAIAFLTAWVAAYFGEQTDTLRTLKESDVPAYLSKLREYESDQRWLAAVKELTPGDYDATIQRLEAEKSEKAKQKVAEAAKKAEQKAAEAARKEEDENAQRAKRALAELKAKAIGYAGVGVLVDQTMFGERWSLIPSEGKLRCELGPVYDNAPRPHVLFDTGGKSYALNGAARGTGKFLDGKALAKGGDNRTIDDLIPIGVEMCERVARTMCGTTAEAYGAAMDAVRNQLKNPDGAKFVASDPVVKSTSCGVWRVASAVDATNGFGAIIRTDFVVELRRAANGNWTANVQFAN